ncbi:MAG: carbohydrate kinase family protein [Fimbriimonadaceae bacterium]|nr:carbohydrate kinase family protein [Fimbriimonadaceae bacterium]
MTGRSALVIGGVSLDEIVLLDRLPDGKPGTVFSRGAWTAIGGTGAGKALNLARLGWTVTLHCLLGDEAAGETIRRHLDEGGVRVLAETDRGGTERHVNLMNVDGERLSIYVHTASANPVLDAEALLAEAGRHEVVVPSIVPYGRALLPRLREAVRDLWVDVHDWDGEDAYHAAFVEAADVVFLSSDRLPNPRDRMRSLVAEGKRLVVCTHGRLGATALTPSGYWHEVPIFPEFERVDSNGAGDSFFAGVLTGHVLGWDLPTSLRAGAWVAGACVACRGLASPEVSLAKLESALRPTSTVPIDDDALDGRGM